MGLVENDESGGRMITKEGQRELDTVSVQAAAEEEEEDEWSPHIAPRVETAKAVEPKKWTVSGTKIVMQLCFSIYSKVIDIYIYMYR